MRRMRARYERKRGQRPQEQSRRRSLCYESDFLVISDHKGKVFLFYVVQGLYSEMHKRPKEASGDYQMAVRGENSKEKWKEQEET